MKFSVLTIDIYSSAAGIMVLHGHLKLHTVIQYISQDKGRMRGDQLVFDLMPLLCDTILEWPLSWSTTGLIFLYSAKNLLMFSQSSVFLGFMIFNLKKILKNVIGFSCSYSLKLLFLSVESSVSYMYLNFCNVVHSALTARLLHVCG